MRLFKLQGSSGALRGAGLYPSVLVSWPYTPMQVPPSPAVASALQSAWYTTLADLCLVGARAFYTDAVPAGAAPMLTLCDTSTC